jgi:hypothetical protein
MQKVRFTETNIPYVGKLRELRTHDGQVVSVVDRRAGGCEVGLRRVGQDATPVTVSLTDEEAVGLAAMLTGAMVVVEVEPKDAPAG